MKKAYKFVVILFIALNQVTYSQQNPDEVKIDPIGEISQGSTSIIMTENSASTLGMSIKYNGSSNNLEISEYADSISASPHLQMNRVTGETKLNGFLRVMDGTTPQVDIVQHNNGGEIALFDVNSRTIKIDGQANNNDPLSGSAITLYDANANAKIIIDAKASNGKARITSEEVSASDGLLVGTTNLPSGFLVAVDGKVICEEVNVELSGNWPDYVFRPDYHLLSLKEVQDHIIKHGHLPGVPSAKEIENGGISLGEINKVLLEKIEELMLYVIKIEQELEHLKSKYK